MLSAKLQNEILPIDQIINQSMSTLSNSSLAWNQHCNWTVFIHVFFKVSRYFFLILQTLFKKATSLLRYIKWFQKKDQFYNLQVFDRMA